MGTAIDSLAIGNCFLDKARQDSAAKHEYSATFEHDWIAHDRHCLQSPPDLRRDRAVADSLSFWVLAGEGFLDSVGDRRVPRV